MLGLCCRTPRFCCHLHYPGPATNLQVEHAAEQHLQLKSAQLPAHHHATRWFAATSCFNMLIELCVLKANAQCKHQCGMLAQNTIPARYSAVTEPMPEVAPVTRATFPFRSVISVLNVKAHHKQAEKHRPTLALTETDICWLKGVKCWQVACDMSADAVDAGKNNSILTKASTHRAACLDELQGLQGSWLVTQPKTSCTASK